MVGNKRRGKTSASKPKPEASALVPADPVPLNVEESVDSPVEGDAENNDASNTDEKLIDEKEWDDICTPLAVDGLEEKQLFLDEGNDEDKKVVNEINDNQAGGDLVSKESEEDPQELSNGSAATSDLDADENEENTDEEDVEEPDEEDEEHLNDDGTANNADGGDTGEETDEEVPEEDEAPMDVSGEEKKTSEAAVEDRITTNEGLVATEHVTKDESMEYDQQNEKEADKLMAGESMDTLADNGKVECGDQDTNGQASSDKASTKRKVVKKKLVKKKMLLKNDLPNETEASVLNAGEPMATHAENGKIETAAVDASGDGNVEATPEKANTLKRKLVKRKVLKKKVVLNNSVARTNEAKSGVAAASDEQKSMATISELGNEAKKESEEEMKDKEATKSGAKGNLAKKGGKKKGVLAGNAESGDLSKPGSSQKIKSSKRVESMGMIFMCNSETKKDCFRYKVLGLPDGKKDLVSKIYKGMRLFLYDVDLRMMYGIYKAASRGGYKIEPRAFNSQFPAQVRFAVLEECIPLAEEKFKKVIKENYYTKKKFRFQLTNEQVKKLCRLFRETTKKADSKLVVQTQIAPPPSSAQRDRKRKRLDDSRKKGPTSSSKREKPRRRPRAEEDVRRRARAEEDVRRRARAEEEVRRVPAVVDDRYYRAPVVYGREPYLPPTAPVTYYQPLPARSPPWATTYGRDSRLDIYRRDPALEPRDLSYPTLRDSRLPVEPDRRDPYVTYRETRPHHEPAYATAVRRDHYATDVRRDPYETGARLEYYDYTSTDGRRVEYFRPTEYRAPLPAYRSRY